MAAFLKLGWLALLMSALALGTVALAVVHAIRAEHKSCWRAIVAVGALVVAGVLATVYGLVHSFGAVHSIDPSMKATQLARGISWAMNCTAVVFVALPLWIAGFVVGEVRRARKRAAEARAKALALARWKPQSPLN